MTYLLIALTYIFGLLAFICGILLAISFTKGQRSKYPILKKLDGMQLRLFIVAITSGIISYGANAAKEMSNHRLYENMLAELKNTQTTSSEPPNEGTTKNLEQFEERLWRVKTEKNYSFDDWFFKARAEYSRGDYRDAISSFTNALKKKPEDIRTYYQRGRAYYQVKEYRNAIRDFNKVIESNPRSTDAYMDRGNSYVSLGQYTDAIKDYTKVIELKPIPVHAYILRGNVFFKLKQFETAEDHYNEVMKLSPGAQVPYNNRGNLFTHTREYEKAASDLKKAIEMDRSYLGAYNSLSQLKIITGDYQGAVSSEAVSLLNRGRGRPEDQAMTIYLECIARNLLGKDTIGCESKLEKVSKEDFTFEWTYHYHDGWFDLYEEWLKQSDIPDDKRQFIAVKTELLKKHRYRY